MVTGTGTPTRAEVAERLMVWMETTHGDEFGHDHHCPLPQFTKKGPWIEEPGEQQQDPERCTCGWSAFRVAYDAHQSAEMASRSDGDASS